MPVLPTYCTALEIIKPLKQWQQQGLLLLLQCTGITLNSYKHFFFLKLDHNQLHYICNVLLLGKSYDLNL